MKAYSESGGTAILNLGNRWRWGVNFTAWPLCSRKTTFVSTAEEAGWVTGPHWTLWRRDKFLVPAGIWTADRSACSLVAIQTTSSWLLKC